MVEPQNFVPGSLSEIDPLKDRHSDIDDHSSRPSFSQAVLLIGIPLVAVIFIMNPFSVFETPKAIMALLLTFVAITINLIRPILRSFGNTSAQLSIDQVIKRNPLYTPSVLVIFALLLACIGSLEPMVSLFGNDRAQTSVFFYLMLIGAMITSFNKSSLMIDRALLASTLLACFLVSLYSVIQALGFDPITWSAAAFGLGRSFSTIGNPVSLAAFHVLTIPICVAAALTFSGRALQLVSVLTLVISLQSLIFTFSRGGWVAAFLSVVLMSVLIFIYKKNLLRRYFLLLIILIAGLISANYIFNSSTHVGAAGSGSTVESKVIDRVQATSGSLDNSTKSRLLAWKSTLIMISEQPIIGFGPLTFTDVWPRYRDSAQFGVDGQIRYYDNPHNLFLELFVSGGLSLFLGVLWLIILSMLCGWKSLVSDRSRSELHPMTIALMASVMGFCVAAFFSFATVAAAYLFVLFLVILASRNTGYSQVSSGIKSGAYIRFAIPGIAIAAIFLIILLRIIIGEVYYIRGGEALDPLKPIKSADLHDLQLSVKVMPWRVDHQIGYATALIRSLDGQKDMNQRSTSQNEALDILIRVIDDQPTQRSAYHALLEHSIRTKNIEFAKQLTVAVFELDPVDPISTYYLGEIALLEGDKAKALKAFRHSYKLQSLDLRPLRKMVVIYLELGDKARAIEVLDTIIQVDRNDETAKKIRKSLIADTGNDHE